MGPIHPLEADYKRQYGIIGRSEYEEAFNILLAQEGVCIRPGFAPRTPCLIPWASIRQIAVGDTSISLTVDYGTPMQFQLPSDALKYIKDSVAIDCH